MQMGSINTECAQWSHAEEHTSLLPLASFLISSTLGNQRGQSLLSKCHLKRIGAGEFSNLTAVISFLVKLQEKHLAEHGLARTNPAPKTGGLTAWTLLPSGQSLWHS